MREKPLNGDTSVKKESAFLHEVAGLCQEGSYLHELFTPDFVAWVEQQIAGDALPDLHGAYQTALAEDTELRSELDAAQKGILQHRETIAKLREVNEHLNEDKEDLREALKETEAKLIDEAVNTSRLEERVRLYRDLRNAAFAVIRRELERAEDEIDQ